MYMWWDFNSWYRQLTMYEVGAYFLSHKSRIRSNKLKRKYRR